MGKVLEKDVEGYLRDEVRSHGWDIHKNISDPKRGGTPGFPDDTIIMRHPYVHFVECKNPQTVGPYLRKRERFMAGGDTTGCSRTEVRQFQEQERLLDKGHVTHIVGTYEEVDDMIDFLECMYG